jgi:PAS domain S-box-containing protein
MDIFSSLPGGAFLLRCDDRTIIEVNQELCRLLGYCREELIGEHCSVICPARETGQEPCCREEHASNIEATIRRRDGSLLPILKSVNTIDVQGQKVLIESFQDFTQRKEAVEMIRQSQAAEQTFREKLTHLHRLLIDLMSIDDADELFRRAVLQGASLLGGVRCSIWLWDGPEGRSCRGTFGIDEQGQLRDERSCRISLMKQWDGVSDSDLESMAVRVRRDVRLFDFFGREVGRGDHAIARICDGKQTLGYLAMDNLLTGEGISGMQEQLMVLLADSLGHLYSILHGETERRRLSSAIEKSAQATTLIDTLGRIVYANPAFVNLLELDEALYLNQPLVGVLGDLESNEMTQLAEAVMRGNQARLRLNRPASQGRELILEIGLTPMTDGSGQIEGFLVQFQDVTHQSELDEQIRNASRMEAIGRLAGGVAHDFNNQLTVIRGYCELLASTLPPDSDEADFTQEIHRATQKAGSLTSELLSFSRKQILQPDVINPNRVLQQMHSSLEVLGSSVPVTFDLALDVGNVRVDPGKLEQAVFNLVLNARDAMAEGGTVAIQTANIPTCPGGAMGIAGQLPGPCVMIAVHDQGVGMDQGTIEQMFEPFFSTKDKSKGTGLGLAMVYGFVKQSGGAVKVDSRIGQGTTVRMYLPRIDQPVKLVSKVGPACPIDRHSESVLVVEDTPGVRKLIVRVLAGHGYRVLETGNPLEAEAIIEAAEESVRMVVTDVIMPEMHGTALAERLVERWPKLKVLYVSGFSESDMLREKIQSDQAHFLQKPFTPDQLSQAVAALLASDFVIPAPLFDE